MDITGIIVRIIDKFENDRNLIEEFTAVGAPKLIYNGADDKYQPIMASEFQFNLMVNDKTDGKFFHLYTGNEKRYLVTVGDQDNNLLFEGYLLPDFYSEPYDNGVIFVDLTATDGLGLLKGTYLPNLYYKQETSVIKLIAECLRFTKLDKNIVFAPAIESAATDYRWDEIAVNGASYLDGEITPVSIYNWVEIMPKRKNAYEILELLLECLGCTLYGQGDTWYIEGINRKHEESQFVYNYDKEGIFQSTTTIAKEVVDLVFFKTPTISIVSPWKRVDVEWDCDEDGDLIPDAELEGIPNGDVLFPSFAPSEFWKTNGLIQLGAFSKEFISKYQKIDFGGEFLFELGQPEKPIVIYVSRAYNEPGNSNTNPPTWGEDITNLPNNYVSIKNRKYLKITDKYIERLFTIKITLNGGNSFGHIEDVIVDDQLSDMFKFDLLSNNSIILTSKDNSVQFTSERFACKVIEESSTYSPELPFGNWYTVTEKHIQAAISKESVELPNNGFFDVKLHAPISIDYINPLFVGYTVADLSVQISELKTWKEYLERDIDFTTTKDISIFHGDSIADLTEKQFRFRRPIYESVGGYGAVEILSTENLFPLQPWIFHYFISNESYAAIQANPELFYVTYLGENIYMNDLNSSTTEAWNIVAAWSGLKYIQIDSTLINHPSGIGSNMATDFQNLFVGESEVYIIGYETEDNEWRESWKRHGQTEDIRYGIAMGKIYHDVQPEALVKIEGNALGCLFPREIGRFLWRDLKKFVPTRLTIDFSKGRTEVLLLENLHEIVTDYVD